MQAKFERFFVEIQKDLKLYGFLLALFSFYRLAFIVAMPEFLSVETTFEDIVFSLWTGLRLSLKSAGIVVLLTFLICSISRFFIKNDFSKARIYFGAVYTVLLSILFLARFPYYKEFHSSFNHNIYNTFKEDGNALFITMIQQYQLGLKLLVAVVLSAVFIYLLKIILNTKNIDFPEFQNKKAKLLFMNSFFVIIPLFALFMRFGGSFNYTNSINWESTGLSKDPFLNEIILDDIQAMYRAYSENKMMKQGTISYVDKKNINLYAEQISTIGKQEKLEDNFYKEAKGAKIEKPKHVFIIVGESYAQWPSLKEYEYLHIADGLNELKARENAAFTKFFVPSGASTAGSVNGLVNGLASVGVYPAYQQETYKGVFSTAIAKQFKDLGYKTVFWHAGFASSGRLKEFALAQGFDEYYGCNDLGLEKTNIWGAKDSAFFNKITEHIKELGDEPTFNIIVTVINHPPYNLDLEKEGFFNDNIKKIATEKGISEELLNILGHYWYTDKEITGFAKKMYDFDNDSLFVITADHADRMNLTATPTLFERFSIPFVIFGKGITKDLIKQDSVGSHLSIAPTLIELIAPKGFKYYSIENALQYGDNKAFSEVVWMTNNAMGRIDKKDEAEVFNNNVDAELEMKSIENKIMMERTLSWWRVSKGNNFE